MLATLTGDLCLLAGLAVLLLPLLATELSRPRDGAWGAIVLLLGLVLVTSSDRLRGAPMLGVACAGLLISRLGAEVAQARWQQLSDEERQRLGSRERWTTSLQQLTTVLASLVSATADTLKSLKPAAKTGTNKRWVRPDESSTGADLDAPAGGEIKETTGTGEKKEANNNDDSSGDGDSNDAVKPEAQVTTPKRPKRWVRPDSPEPSLEAQEAPPPSNSDEAPDEALNGTSAEASTDRSEDGSKDTASNSASNSASNTARTDED
ncbi:Ycf66 family protein [Synechococcus sp. ROS8604]|uniref:Ycf66 family protein n=1 Tax=Synechococcus sp. ROS8604 TaxID=1442557 RepID=UPI001646D359|nr:Ycf66 family protein [Synechococcus sp. ROS8604]QNI87193.1 putative N-terminaldomain of isoleucyl-tRNA synthetase [Synechococcus sp. ROS8604]